MPTASLLHWLFARARRRSENNVVQSATAIGSSENEASMVLHKERQTW